MPISFHQEDKIFPDYFDADKTKQWLLSIAQFHSVELEDLNYIFSSDDYLLDINKQYLNHDYYTDIITFPMGDGKKISGDIFISLDRVNDNAKNYEVEEQNELLRVIAHGLLHLIGFKDKSEEEAKEMREKEEEAINLWSHL